MTPKEKAKELVDKFTNTGKVKYLLLDSEIKECALIAVDEIIKTLHPDTSEWGDNQWRANEYILYWQEVKQEIEKL